MCKGEKIVHRQTHSTFQTILTVGTPYSFRYGTLLTLGKLSHVKLEIREKFNELLVILLWDLL